MAEAWFERSSHSGEAMIGGNARLGWHRALPFCVVYAGEVQHEIWLLNRT
jgi:hypothetical protein